MRQRPGPTVLTAWTGTLLRALEARGIDGAALAAAAGIASDALADPDRRVPLAASTRLWAEAVAATGDPALGIEVSRYVRATTFHALGQAFLASPTLRAALERAARYSRVTADHAIGAAEARGGEFRLSITWRPGAAVPAFEAVDAVFAAIVRSARFMLDRSVAPVRVELERPRPSVTERFDAFFRCPIAYQEQVNVLVFDRATVDRPVPAGNAALARAGDTILAAHLGDLEPDTATDRTRRAAASLLQAGEPSLAAAAGVSAPAPARCSASLPKRAPPTAGCSPMSGATSPAPTWPRAATRSPSSRTCSGSARRPRSRGRSGAGPVGPRRGSLVDHRRRYGCRPSAGTVPRRPAWKSSTAWTSSARVFITNGP